MKQPKYRLKRNRRQYDIVDAKTGEVVEGGFFDYDAAKTSLDNEWNRPTEAEEHEGAHARGAVDARICQGIGCPFGDR